MKKLNLNLAIIIVIAMLTLLVVGCTPADNTKKLPAFSIDFVDGDTTITVTDSTLKNVILEKFELKGDHYMGLKIADVLSAITGLSDIEQIESLLVIAGDEERYGVNFPPLISENFDNAYFAVMILGENEEYEYLNEANGPVRLFDLTAGTQTKSIKNVAEVIVNRGIVLPAFSIDIEDGDNTLTLTNGMLKGIELIDFDVVSKGNTIYYKGVKVSAVLPVITGLTDIAQITSLTVIAEDGYGENTPPLISANFDNAYFAVFVSEDGEEYEFLDNSNGPVRLFDLTEDTETKSIKNVAQIIVNR